MRAMLRKCRVSYGPNDNIKTSEFELVGCDWITYKPSGKPQHLLQIGERMDEPDAVNL